MGFLIDPQIVDCRRFCGYEAFGASVNPASGYRFFTAYGALEYRMNNLTPNEAAVITTKLTNLNQLESDIFGSTGTRTNLDTDQAAVWKHNPNELRDRQALYRMARFDLCQFFGVPPGPGLATSNQMVV